MRCTFTFSEGTNHYKLLQHAEMDVKVSVFSCIIEITRILAPDALYKDVQMKEIFQLILAAFENMSHVSTRSYKKVVSILDTIAKVNLCLVMLDLECDALVMETFQSFLKILRSNHPPAGRSDRSPPLQKNQPLYQKGDPQLASLLQRSLSL